LDPTVEGVRQDSLESLERTLSALAAEYAKAGPERKKAIRGIAIEARRHAEWAKRAESELWIRTWLENPPLFPVWAALRRRALSGSHIDHGRE
jgi:hypothetical protein